MALGVGGTGPYAEIRRLREYIRQNKYELWLISEGHKRRLGRKKLEEMIEIDKARIKEILDTEKLNKQKK